MEFFAQHELYIVMVIVLGIWLGLYMYLFRLDRRIKKLERSHPSSEGGR